MLHVLSGRSGLELEMSWLVDSTRDLVVQRCVRLSGESTTVLVFSHDTWDEARVACNQIEQKSTQQSDTTDINNFVSFADFSKSTAFNA